MIKREILSLRKKSSSINPEVGFEDSTRDKSALLLLRGRKPVYSNYTRQATLDFGGRVTKASKKNIQIEYKSRADNKIRVVL